MDYRIHVTPFKPDCQAHVCILGQLHMFSVKITIPVEDLVRVADGDFAVLSLAFVIRL